MEFIEKAMSAKTINKCDGNARNSRFQLFYDILQGSRTT